MSHTKHLGYVRLSCLLKARSSLQPVVPSGVVVDAVLAVVGGGTYHLLLIVAYMFAKAFSPLSVATTRAMVSVILSKAPPVAILLRVPPQRSP